MSFIPFILTSNEEEAIHALYPVFMYNGNPTSDYKQFLLELACYITTADTETRDIIANFLMRCEEGVYVSITGIICIQKTDKEYKEYATILNALYGEQFLEQHEKHVTISNTLLVNMIQTMEKGCLFRPCHRKNRLHQQFMHQTYHLKF